MSTGMWLLVVLFIAGMIGVMIQHHAMKKMRSGFSLRGEDGTSASPRRSKFPDPEEEATRRWLEGEDLNEPQSQREHGESTEGRE